MTQVIKINEYIEFKAEWGVYCNPIQYENFYYLPLGWEEELDKRNISYEIIEITIDDN
jgi:hypothetical protein